MTDRPGVGAVVLALVPVTAGVFGLTLAWAQSSSTDATTSSPGAETLPSPTSGSELSVEQVATLTAQVGALQARISALGATLSAPGATGSAPPAATGAAVATGAPVATVGPADPAAPAAPPVSRPALPAVDVVTGASR